MDNDAHILVNIRLKNFYCSPWKALVNGCLCHVTHRRLRFLTLRIMQAANFEQNVHGQCHPYPIAPTGCKYSFAGLAVEVEADTIDGQSVILFDAA